MLCCTLWLSFPASSRYIHDVHIIWTTKGISYILCLRRSKFGKKSTKIRITTGMITYRNWPEKYILWNFNRFSLTPHPPPPSLAQAYQQLHSSHHQHHIPDIPFDYSAQRDSAASAADAVTPSTPPDLSLSLVKWRRLSGNGIEFDIRGSYIWE